MSEDDLTDEQLLLSALVAGVARWEAFQGTIGMGEVCVGCIRYSTHLDERGCPILYPHLRYQIGRELGRIPSRTGKGAEAC